jgi:predicted O-methyltransferase YrrM
MKNIINNCVNEWLEISANKIPKTDSNFHELTLFSLAISTKATTILELGVRDGGTTLPLLLAAHINKGTLHSVDINTISYRPPKELENNWIMSQNINALDFLSTWNPTKVIDMVFIDDWHSYEHVKQELQLLDKYVSPKSIILVHDTMYSRWEPHYHCDLTLKDGQWGGGGPYRAVAELDPNFWEFSTIPVNNGLTIVRKKHTSKFYF